MEAHTFTLPHGREMLTAERAQELVQPLVEHSDPKLLTSIHLSGKSFSTDAARIFTENLERFENLKHVDLSDIIAGRNTEEAMEVFGIFCAFLKGYQLESLNLSDNAIGLRSAPIVANALKSQKHLQHLLLNNDGLQGDALKIIVDAMLDSSEQNGDKTSVNTSLESIELYRNLLGSAGGEALVPLVEHSPNLRHIAISSSRVGEEGAYPLCVALTSLQNLRHLNLSDNSLGEESALVLAKGLLNSAHSSSLSHVNLGDIGCGEEGMTAILTALSSNTVCPQLSYLDLQSNELTSKQAKLLAKVIERHPTLQTLILENNDLKSRSAVRCIRAFRSHPNVAEVNFIENSLRSPVIEHIIEIFGAKNSLRSLKLNANRFRPESVDKLRSAFKGTGDDDEEGNSIDVLGSLSENDDDDDDDEEDDEEEEEEEEVERQEELDEIVENLANQLKTTL